MEAILNTFGQLDKYSPEPLYLQIRQIIERYIEDGDLRAGQKLPSENELVDALDVSRMTVNRALAELARQGLVNRVHGKGTFVAERPRHASLIELQDIASEVTARGKSYRCSVIDLRTEAAGETISRLMGVTTGSELYFLRAVHFQDDVPIQLESRYVNPLLVPEFNQQDFTLVTSTAYLLKQFRPDEMEHIASAVIADSSTRELLQIDANQPCLQLSRRTWFDQKVVTRVIMIYPGNRYDLGARYATSDYEQRS